MKQIAEWLAALVFVVAMLYWFESTITDPTYQNGLTTRYEAQQQTNQVRAREFGDTLRTWGMWGGGAFAVVGGLVAIGWTVRYWQEQRTLRHEATEEQTTERLRITAKKDIVLAYLAVCGDPDATQGRLNGIDGVFLPASNEFVPLDVCRAELAANQGTALARRTPHTINVPPARQERRFLVTGQMEREDW